MGGPRKRKKGNAKKQVRERQISLTPDKSAESESSANQMLWEKMNKRPVLRPADNVFDYATMKEIQDRLFCEQLCDIDFLLAKGLLTEADVNEMVIESKSAQEVNDTIRLIFIDLIKTFFERILSRLVKAGTHKKKQLKLLQSSIRAFFSALDSLILSNEHYLKNKILKLEIERAKKTFLFQLLLLAQNASSAFTQDNKIQAHILSANPEDRNRLTKEFLELKNEFKNLHFLPEFDVPEKIRYVFILIMGPVFINPYECGQTLNQGQISVLDSLSDVFPDKHEMEALAKSLLKQCMEEENILHKNEKLRGMLETVGEVPHDQFGFAVEEVDRLIAFKNLRPFTKKLSDLTIHFKPSAEKKDDLSQHLFRLCEIEIEVDGASNMLELYVDKANKEICNQRTDQTFHFYNKDFTRRFNYFILKILLRYLRAQENEVMTENGIEEIVSEIRAEVLAKQDVSEVAGSSEENEITEIKDEVSDAMIEEGLTARKKERDENKRYSFENLAGLSTNRVFRAIETVLEIDASMVRQSKHRVYKSSRTGMGCPFPAHPSEPIHPGILVKGLKRLGIKPSEFFRAY